MSEQQTVYTSRIELLIIDDQVPPHVVLDGNNRLPKTIIERVPGAQTETNERLAVAMGRQITTEHVNIQIDFGPRPYQMKPIPEGSELAEGYTWSKHPTRQRIRKQITQKR